MPAEEDQQDDEAPIRSLVIPSLDHQDIPTTTPLEEDGTEEEAILKISETAAVEAIQELSLSSESPTASRFDPKPLVMSRGDSSLSSLEDMGSPPRIPPAAKPKFFATKTHPLQEIGHGDVYVSQNSSRDSSSTTNDGDQIVLTANHQHRLSSRSNIVKVDSTGSSNPNNNSQHSSNSQRNNNNSNNGSRSTSPTPAPVKALLAPINGALGWIQKQRERQNERHLKELAEEQMRKLKLAQKNDPTVNFTVVVPEDDSQSEYGGGFCFEPKPSQQQQSTPQSYTDQEEEEEEEGSSQRMEDEDDISWIPAVRVVEEQVRKGDVPISPRSSGSNGSGTNSNIGMPDPTKPVPFLLTPEQMHDIARYVLPKGIAFCRWKRLYSLTRDGDSFFQCMRLCGSETKSLMIIKTTRGAIFGGYADAPWEVHSHQTGKFHGSAQACLFSFAISSTSETTAPTSATNNPTTTTNLQVFHWTGANRYIQYTDTSETKRMLAFGGGGQEGAFGLCVEQDFQLGSTGPCDTFNNLPLCDQENFHILDLEIWGFLTGQF